jgi:hypothetical protein
MSERDFKEVVEVNKEDECSGTDNRQWLSASQQPTLLYATKR